jgi:hypothetical protein
MKPIYSRVIICFLFLLAGLVGFDVETSSYSQLSERCALIEGRVVDPTGEPLEVDDALLLRKVISLIAPKPHYRIADAWSKDLGDGHFKMDACDGSGIFVLEIKSPGYIPKRLENVEVILGSTIELGDIVLSEPAGIITGRVLNDEDDTPIYWIKVRAVNKIVAEHTDTDWTDKEGHFSFSNLFPGEYKIQISNRNYTNQETDYLAIAPGQKLGLTPFKVKKESQDNQAENKKKRDDSIGIYIPSLKCFFGGDGGGKDDNLNIFLPIGLIAPGSALEKAGLKKGDVIIKINDNYFNLLNRHSVVLKDLLGKPGTKVKLTIRRKDREKEEDVEVIIEDWDYHETWEYFEGE